MFLALPVNYSLSQLTQLFYCEKAAAGNMQMMGVARFGHTLPTPGWN